MSQEFRKLINESNINRVRLHLSKYDCAIITAWRSQMIDCLYDDDDLGSWVDSGEIIDPEKGPLVKREEKEERNKVLKSTLLYYGYGVTKVRGTYVENYLTNNAVEVKEDSYFVSNINEDPQFISRIIELGKEFCQDSVLIMPKGGKANYLYGTNLSSFPGLDNIERLGEFRADEGEFMTKISGKPFVAETFTKSQINSKRLITKYGRPLAEKINKKI